MLAVKQVIVRWVIQKQSPVSHVDEGEDAVEGGHEDVSDRKVQQEVVCYTPHLSMSWKRDEMH